MGPTLADVLQEMVGEKYELDRELGGGGMSSLFLATERVLHRRVVIKVLSPDLICRASMARFKREIDVTVRLQHPNILQILDAGARGDIHYYVTPYVAGETLRRRLEREGSLPVPDAVRLLRELADSVAYAHDGGVIHRDIKPENIFLSAGHAVLADFGIARALADVSTGARVTATGTAVGTIGYTTPEWDPDARGDIYAIAVVGYEMLTGRRPHPALSLSSTSDQAIPPGVPAFPPEVPPAVARAILTGLAAAPDDRFASAAEFRDALSEPVAAELRPPPRLRRWLVAGTALIAAASLAWLVPRHPPLNDDLIAIAPFYVSAGPLEPWREDMVEWVTRDLDGAGALRSVPATRVLRLWGAGDGEEPAAALGRATAARYVVTGSVTALAGDSVRLAAALYDVADDRHLADFEFRDAQARVDQLPDSLTLAVLRELNRSNVIGAVRVRDPLLGARSIPALKAFFRGEQEYRRNRWTAAQAHYEAALREDPGFALALRRMRNVLRRDDELDARSLEYALRAGEANRGLGPRDSMFVAADSAFAAVVGVPRHSPEWWSLVRRRFALLDALVVRDATDPEAWLELGEALYHYGDYVGRTEQQTAHALERAIAFDPDFAPPYFHAIELAFRLRGAPAADSLAAAYLRVNPGDVGVGLVQTLVRATHPDLARYVHETSPDEVMRAAYLMHRWPDSAETALQLYRHLFARDAAAASLVVDQQTIRLRFFLGLMYRGRLAEAYRVGSPELVYRHAASATQLALFGAVPADSMRLTVARWIGDNDLRKLLAALPWLLAERDSSTMQRLARWCELTATRAAVDDAASNGCYGAYGARVSGAYLALAGADTTRALALFAALPDSLCVRDCVADRILRAHLLADRGRYAEAASVLDRYPQSPERFGVHEGLTMAAAWRIAHARRDDAISRRARAFVAAVWSRADPALRGGADDATGQPTRTTGSSQDQSHAAPFPPVRR